MKLKTVNVITIKNDVVDSIVSFDDNDKGNRLAEKCFIETLSTNISNFDEYTPEDLDACIENGYESFGTGCICLAHSE